MDEKTILDTLDRIQQHINTMIRSQQLARTLLEDAIKSYNLGLNIKAQEQIKQAIKYLS